MPTPWRLRVLRRDGSLDIPDLDHLEGTRFSTFGYLPGHNSLSAAFGTATVPVIPPLARSDAQQAQLASIGYMDRLEVYVRADGAGAPPRFTGLIDKPAESYEAASFGATDSLLLLQKSTTRKNENLIDTALGFVDRGVRRREYLFGDKFRAPDLSAYTNVGGWARVAAGWTLPQPSGRAGAQVVAPAGNALLISGHSPTTYADFDGDVNAWLTIVAGETRIGVGLVFGYNAGAYYVALLELVPAGAGNPVTATAKIVHVAADGTLVRQGIASSWKIAVMPASGPLSLHVQIGVEGREEGYRLRLDGQMLDAIALTSDLGFGAPAGPFGVMAYAAAASTILVSDLHGFELQRAFQTDFTGITDSGPLTQLFNQANKVDQVAFGAAALGLPWYKEPRAGWGNDIVRLGTPAGYAVPATLQEARGSSDDDANIMELQHDRADQQFASELAVQGKGAGSDPVVYYARDLASLQRFGVLTRQYNAEDVRDFDTLSQIGEEVVGLSANPDQTRTITTAIPPGPTTWRELVDVIVDAPRRGIHGERRQVIGYEVQEDTLGATAHLDQYPIEMSLSHARALRKQVDNLLAGALTPVAGPGVPGVNAQGPNTTVWDGGPYPKLGIGDGWPSGITGFDSGGNPVPIVGGAGGLVQIGGAGIDFTDTPVTAGQRVVLGHADFPLYDHPCNVFVLAMFEGLVNSTGVTEYYIARCAIGTDTTGTTDLNSGMQHRFGSNVGTWLPMTISCPPTNAIPPGPGYRAYVELVAPALHGGEIIGVSGEILVFCV
ncbi:MAG: hypothetical protein ABR598_07685 [Candidatus Dormibacteria bacterium]